MLFHAALQWERAKHKLDWKFTKDNPYLAVMEEFGVVYYEDLDENWSRYRGIALYVSSYYMYSYVDLYTLICIRCFIRVSLTR